MPTAKVVPKHTDSNGWWATKPSELFVSPKPSGEIRVQTAIIGGGICGVSTANRLGELRPNDRICLIDAERIGFGASGRNAGFMLNVHSHGPQKAIDILRRNINLWETGLNSLRKKVEQWQIQCDWSEFGRIYGAAGPVGEKHIDEIAETLDKLGHKYKWYSQSDMENRIGTEFYGCGLHAEGSALVNPAALMVGLARNLPTNVDVYENTSVQQFDRVGKSFRITTDRGIIYADRIVLSAGVFIRQFGIAKNTFVPMATYGSLTEVLDDAAISQLGAGKEFGILGASDYGATIRLTQNRQLFVRNMFNFVPGAPLSGERVKQISRLHREAMTKRWPGLADVPFEHSWGGIMAFTFNNGTVFGEYKPGIYVVLTNDVSPMTRGEAAGALMAEYMEGLDSDLLAVQLSIPNAKTLPPRPFLDLGIGVRKALLHLAARREF